MRMGSSSGSTGWFTRAVLLIFIIPAALPAEAQAPAGNAAAVSGQVSTPTGQPAVSAQVRICPITASQATCTPLASLFTNSALTVQSPNPVATDAYGNYKVFLAAGLYLVQVTVSPGLTYTYYAAAGSSSTGGGSSPPAYSVQFASTTPGQFGSDSTTFINPTQHILQTNELFVPGTGTGQLELGGQTSGDFVTQTVADNTSAWSFVWPSAPPSGSGTNCLTGTPTTLSVGSWQPCILSGAYLPLTGGTLTGPLIGTSANFQSTNTVINAALSTASGDIGAKVNQSFLTCGYQCLVYVPAGTYNFSTTISMPLNPISTNSLSTYALVLDPGAVLLYQGSGDAINLPPATAGPSISGCRISGGQIYGTSAGRSGIHLWPTNSCNITNMVVASFSSGYGVWIDGANMVNIDHSTFFDNDVGIYMTNTFCTGGSCNDAGSGSPYTPNAIYITNNGIFSNTIWGVQSFSPQTGGNPGPLNITIANNDLELNGNPFTIGTYSGAVSVGRSRNLVIRENYFEGSPLGIVLGIPGGGDSSTRYFASIGPIIRDNYFTLEDTQNPTGTYEIDLLDSADAIIEGNSTQGASENTDSCFVNSLALAGGNIGETGTYLGKNHFETDENTSEGNYTCVAGVSNVLQGVGSFPILDSNYIPYLAYYNWAANATLTTENVAIQYLVPNGGTCYLYPISANARTSFAAQTTYANPITVANQVTIVHPATASLNFNIYCNRSVQ
jgi:hypothetical protein